MRGVKRIDVPEEIDRIDFYQLEGPMEQAINFFLTAYESYKDKYVRLELVEHEGWDSSASSLKLIGYRPETDAEYETRCKKVESARKLQAQKKLEEEEREHALYLDLKKKYETDEDS